MMDKKTREDVIEHAIGLGHHPEWCPWTGEHWVRCAHDLVFRATGSRIIPWPGQGTDTEENARVIAALALGVTVRRVPA